MASLVVISSFAQDRYHNLKDGVRSVRRGGPARWITETLQQILIPFELITGAEDCIVDIAVGGNEEKGTIASLSQINAPDIPFADAYIVSTIGDEFDLGRIPDRHAFIALDAQGYVRCARMARRPFYALPSKIRDHITVLKATAEEVAYLDPDFVKKQKSRMLLLTKGSRGFDLFSMGICASFPASQGATPPDTVGAGDTLLAAFVTMYLRYRDRLIAAYRARKYVEKFLDRK